MTGESSNKTLQNRIIVIVLIILAIAGIVYLGFYILNLINPVFEEIPTKSSGVELQNKDLEIIQNLENVNTYLLQPTVAPEELGKPNPFDPI